MMEKQNTTNIGISPVVGIAMMIMITTALAAVTGVFVLDLADFDQSAQVSASIEDNPQEQRAVVRIVSIQNADQVIITVTGQDTELTRTTVGQTVVIGDPSEPDVELEYVEGEEIQILTELDNNRAVRQIYELGQGST